MFKRIFWNAEEKRIAVFWRLILQVLILLILMTGSTWIAVPTQDFLSALSIPSLPVRALISSIINLLEAVPMVLSVWLAGRLLDRRKFTNFGLHFNARWWQDFAFGLGLGAALMSLIFVVELRAGWIILQSNSAQAEQGFRLFYPLAAYFFYFAAVGVREEIIFRGYQLKNLAEGLANLRSLSPTAAIVISTVLSSILFGVVHLANPNATWISALNIALAGVFLAMGFLLTGELAIPIGLHIAWNYFQGNIFGFPVSGSYPNFALFSSVQTGPAWMTGGAFGPEGGLIGVIAILLGIALTLLHVRWRDGKAQVFLPLTQAEFLPRRQKSKAETSELPQPESEPGAAD